MQTTSYLKSNPFNEGVALSTLPQSAAQPADADTTVWPVPEPGDNGRKNLSARESEVLDLLVQGCYYQEIFDRLEISYATVHTHVRHIYKKYQVHSRGQAVAKFLVQRVV